MLMKRLVILISGRGSNLEAILDRCASDHWPVEVVRVISNRPDAQGLAAAQSRGVPTGIVDHTRFLTREAFDQALSNEILECRPDLIVLAGFMRVLSSGFCRAFEGRLLNIHPSLLPAFKGLKTHEQAISAGVKVHGCTVHAVTADLDHGPILAQAIVPVLLGDTAATLAARVLLMEHQIYPMAIAAVLSGRCRLIDGRWVDSGVGHFKHEYVPCLVDKNLPSH